MKEIIIKIDYVDFETTVLINENGDTFTFNPQSNIGEELTDFLT